MSIMKRFGIVVTSIAICLLAILLILRVHKISTEPIFENEASPEAVEPVNTGKAFNVLLIGADASGKLADAIMLVNVNEPEQKISMLSIPRDTKVYMEGRYRKINSCYMSGVDCLIDSVKQLTGVTINYYAAINPGTLAAIVDSLGGVELTIDKNMYYADPAQNLYINLKKGTQTLNGQQAEQYCRYRQYLMGDYERAQAQQKFFKALFEQKLNAKNITKLYDVYNAVSDKLKTNVTISDIASNIGVMKMLKSDSQIECYDAPGHYNDMETEGISYFLIYDKYLNELRTVCNEHFKVD